MIFVGFRRFSGLVQLLFAMFILLSVGQVMAATAKDVAEDFDNYFVPVFPTVYGEIINTLPADEVANISTVLRGLEIFGYLKSLGDVANAIDSGNNTEAAIEAASTLAKMIVSYGQAQGATGFAVMGSSVGMLPVTALITAIDLARSSRKAVAASQTALNLERLYGSIEHDRDIRDSNRKLGEGDPIKVTSTSIDRLWRRIINDPEWGELFKTYVTSELNQPWPEPSLWDRISIPAEVRREALLFEEQTRLKSHIATLLLELNKVAQKREAEVVLAKQMRDMAAQALKIDPEQFKEALARYREAMVLLPTIQAYATELPEKVSKYQARFVEANTLQLVDFKKKYGKEPSLALTELRFEILEESQTIIRRANTLRAIPPNDKKAGGEKHRLLTLFKDSYLKLWPIRDSISTLVVNTKLIAETQAATSVQTEFVFTRHAPENGFDEYAKDFIEPVRQGAPDALEKAGKAQSAVAVDFAKMRSLYEEDLLANQKILKQSVDTLEGQIKSLTESLARTSDSRQRDILRNRIDELKRQLVTLRQRWTSYFSIHQLNVKVDSAHYAEVDREIRQFLEANKNRYGTIWEAIETHYRDATRKHTDFYRMRQSNSRHPSSFLSTHELEHLRGVMEKNTGGYIGLAENFLSQHLPGTPGEKAHSIMISKAIDAMQKEIRDQMGKTNQFRMEYYPDWETYTVPSLEYMGSKEADAEIKNLSDSVENALKFLRSVDPSDIQPSNRGTFKSRIEELELRKRSVEELRQQATKASSLVGPFQSYILRAKKNNEMIAEDNRFLSSLYTDFQPAASQLSATIGGFLANNHSYLALADSSNSVMPKILPSSQIVEILKYRDILNYSAKAGLGLEKLLESAFAELPATGGMVSLTADFLGALESRISSLPTSSYAVYQPEMQKILDESQVHRTLFRFARIEAFQAQFAFDGQLSSAIKRLAKTMANVMEEVNRNQAILDAEAGHYNAILQKLNTAIDMAQNAIAAQNWGNAASLEHFQNETRGEYTKLGKKRADVDAAFERLQQLIDEAKSKQGRAPLPFADGEIDETKLQTLYQDFINAYAQGNVGKLVALLAADWSGGDGSDIRDVENTLINSFRVFDRIQYRISGFSALPIGNGRTQVSYRVLIIGENSRQRLRHEESSQVVEEVGMVDGKPRILRTLSGSQWLR